MSKAGKRILEGLSEALAWARGETAMKVTRFVNGKPQSKRMTIDEYLDAEADTKDAEADAAFVKLRRE